MVSNSQWSIRSLTYGTSITATPLGFRIVAMPRTTPLRPATWASTLLPCTPAGQVAGGPVASGAGGGPFVAVRPVRAVAGRGQLLGEGGAEELGERRDPPLLAGDPRDGGRRPDAEHRDALVVIVLEQVAVIARDLHGQALRAEPFEADEPTDDVPCVLDDGVGEGREVRVLPEQDLRGHRLGDLHE